MFHLSRFRNNFLPQKKRSILQLHALIDQNRCFKNHIISEINSVCLGMAEFTQFTFVLHNYTFIASTRQH